MAKTLVTHMNPDLDAISSVWLFRRFDPQFSDASVVFVPAGTTFKKQPPDQDEDIVHVDTGMGMFDHHQTSKKTCAAEIILHHLQEKFTYLRKDQALERLVQVIVGVDHFEECYWPEPNHDRYSFMLSDILNGLKRNNSLTDQGLVDFGSTCLDGVYTSLDQKIQAELELENGQEFETKWGRGIAIEGKNDDVLTVGQKSGFVVVIRKDPRQGMLRIKAQPHSEADLTNLYQALKSKDPKASWFLHASKKMLLNGSYKNPDTIPSKLSINEVIQELSKD